MHLLQAAFVLLMKFQEYIFLTKHLIFSDDDEPPTPEKAKAKVEEALLDLKDAAQEDNLLLN